MATYLQRLNPAATSPSLGIWEQFPAEDVLSGGRRGFYKHYDFCVENAVTAGTPDWETIVDEDGAGGSTTVVQSDGHGGLLTITTDNAEYDGAQLSHGGAEWLLLSSCDMVCLEARLKLEDVDDMDLFFGLSVDPAGLNTILADDTAHANESANHLGFESLDATAVVTGVNEAAGTRETEAALATLVDDTYVKLGFVCYEDGKVDYFVNGALADTKAASVAVPATEMRPVLVALTGAAAAHTATVDWIRIGALFSD